VESRDSISILPRLTSTVPYAFLADFLLLLHGAFVLFVVGGGLLVLRWPWLKWVHLPAALWGAGIELSGFICPLTPLEKAWRRAAGGQAYEGGFIEHYVTAALYPAGLTRAIQVALGVAVLGLNGWVYWKVWRRGTGRSPA
jgi:hypothetical protein